MKSIEHIHQSWCVKNDNSQLFKDTVIKYLNTKYINTDYSGNFNNRYYGIDKHNNTWSNNTNKDFIKELTLDEFIKLTKQEMKYFKLNQTVYHPVYGEGEVISTNHDFADCKILVQFKNSTVSFREDGSDYHTKVIVLSQTPIPEIVNKSLEDIYIPFTWEDRELLRGRWIKTKEECSWEGMICFVNEGKVGVDSTSYYTYEQLLNKFIFIDGKVCGKLA